MGIVSQRERFGARGTRAFKSFVSRSSDRRLERTIGSRLGLRLVFGRIAAHFPASAAGFAGELQCDLLRADGTVVMWTIDTRSGRAAVRPGAADQPAVTARLTVADFARVIGRDLDPGWALLQGRLDVSGDFLAVTHLGDVFGT